MSLTKYTFKGFANNDKFFDSKSEIYYNYNTKIVAADKFEPISSLGAPAGTQVAGIDAVAMAKTHVDFNSSNNLNYRDIQPVTSLNVTSEHSDAILTAGTADVIVTWQYLESEAGKTIHGASGSVVDNTIDGFLVQVKTSKSSIPPNFGDGDAATVVKFVLGQTNYQYAITGGMDSWYSFSVIAYRSVKADATHGSLIKSARVPTTPLQPAPYMRFNGVEVKDLNVSVQNMADYNVVEPVEKKSAFPKYLHKVSTEFFPLLDRVALIDTATPKSLTAQLNNLIAAQTALDDLVFSNLYPISSSSVKGTPTNRWSPLFSGHNYKIEGISTNPWYNNDPLMNNADLPHYIADRDAFYKVFTDYDTAYSELVQAANLLEGLKKMGSDVTLISELADSVLTAAEKVSLKTNLAAAATNKTAIQLDMLKTCNIDWYSQVTAAYSAFNVELNTKNRLSYDTVTKQYGTVANHPFLFDVSKSSRFASSDDVLTFFAAATAWETTYSSAQTSVAAAKAAFAAEKLTWADDGEIYALFTGVAANVPLITASKKLYADINVTWASVKKTLDTLGIVETVTSSLAVLLTELTKNRTCYDSVGVTGTNTLNLVKTQTIVFQTLAEAKAFYTAVINLKSSYLDVAASHAAKLSATVISFDGLFYTNGTALAAATNLSLTFGTDTDDDGAINSTVSWSYGDTQNISGFCLLVTAEAKDLITSRSCNRVFYNRLTARIAKTELTQEFDLAAKRYVNAYLMAYRRVTKDVYDASTLAGAYKQKDDIGGVVKYYLFSPVTQLATTGHLPQVTSKYIPVNYIGGTKPVGIKKLDYWLNSSRTATTEGILPHTWGKYNGTIFSQLSDTESANRLPKVATTDFTISSTVEPLNKPGFFWYNTSTKAVSGVKAGVKAYWDVYHGLWLYPNTYSHIIGTAITASSIVTPAYEGSLYLNPNTYQIFRARNGTWSQFVDLGATEVGSIPPVKTLTVKRYYDKVGWKYYVRYSTTLDWIEQDLLLKTPLKTATKPTGK